MRVRMADLQAQFDAMQAEIGEALREVFASCRFILGPNVEALESEIAQYSDARYAIGVNSGTDAIMLALAACGVGQDDEVITTPFTFVATTETIVQLKAKPVYVDIDPATFNLDASQVEAKITPRTKAIVPVHLYGQTADLTKLSAIAEKHNLALISDGAQAIGAKHKGKGIGGYGHAVTLSFFPTKNLGGAGDGGMVLTNDETIFNQVRKLRFHGSAGTYDYDEVGWCSRLDEVQAAILRVKLRYLDSWNARRAANAAHYTEALKNSGITIPVTMDSNVHVWHQYTLQTSKRDELKSWLNNHDIDSAVYYPSPLHLAPAYCYLGAKEGDCPQAERACREVLSLPIHPGLTDEEVARVSESILEFQKTTAPA